MDKSWMAIRNRLSTEYRNGVKSFIQFAVANAGPNDELSCPCKDCMNCERLTSKLVEYHLIWKGISPTYTTWVHHGEHVPIYQPHVPNDEHNDEGQSVRDGISDVDEEQETDGLINMLEDYYTADAMNNNDDDDDDNELLDSSKGAYVQNFEKLLDDAQRELYPGCKKFTVLSFVIKMLHVKVMSKWTNKSFNMNLSVFKDALPESTHKIPWTIYEAKKFLSELGLGYLPIHACKYDCALFWKENANLEKCPICEEPRYKLNDNKGKKIPHKILRYFPLTPRLRRLYMSRKTATDMRWHKEQRVDDGILRHPADGEAWKDFDQQHPLFSRECRNVRLGLATDGFNPFGNMSNSYSMWPVIVVPYNLPPWKCMKQPFSMMSLLIPGPQAPGRDIDVFLQPLIDELKELWESGVVTFDASIGQTFRLHAAVMWTKEIFISLSLENSAVCAFYNGSNPKPVRGKSRGKNIDRLITQNGGQKIFVPVPEQARTVVGPNASKVASLIGVQIRLQAPLQGVKTWDDISIGVRSSIIQAIRDKFNIDGYDERFMVRESINKKCRNLYRNWKSKMKAHYLALLEDGVDEYTKPYKGVRPEDWTYMIDHVWKDDTHQKRANKNKFSRSKLPYNHVMGSMSFPTAMSMMASENGGEEPHIADFFRDSHWSKQRHDWIDPKCADLHVELVKRKVAVLDGELSMTQEEMSIEVLGKRSGYLKGFGHGPKPSSSYRFTAASQAHDEEVQDLKTEIHSLREIVKSQQDEIQTQTRLYQEQHQIVQKMQSFMMQFTNWQHCGDSSTSGH